MKIRNNVIEIFNVLPFTGKILDSIISELETLLMDNEATIAGFQITNIL